jgi:hypothetical protein
LPSPHSAPETHWTYLGHEASFHPPWFLSEHYRTRGAILPEVRLGLEAALNVDGVEITNVKDLTVSLDKTEAI